MCYSALVLAMMFSMGEPLPYHHYGKSSSWLRLGRPAEPVLGRVGCAGTFPGGDKAQEQGLLFVSRAWLLRC